MHLPIISRPRSKGGVERRDIASGIASQGIRHRGGCCGTQNCTWYTRRRGKCMVQTYTRKSGTSTQTQTHAHTHEPTHIQMHAHTRTPSCTHTRTHARTHTHTHAHTHTHTRTHAHICRQAWTSSGKQAIMDTFFRFARRRPQTYAVHLYMRM
jgi:hypothetical protein